MEPKPSWIRSTNWRWLEPLLIPTFTAVVLILIFTGIGRSIWLDEALSVSVARLELPDIVAWLKQDNNFPLYFVILRFWMHLFGDSEIALRLLSALFYIGAAFAIYFIGRQLLEDERSARYSAFCYLFSAQAIRSAQNVRCYALLGFFAALSTLLFARLLTPDRTSRRNWIAFAAVTAIGLFVHLWYAFVVVGQLAAVLLWGRTRLKSFLAAALVSVLPFLAFWGPAFLQQVRSHQTDWFPRVTPLLFGQAATDLYGGRLSLFFFAACVFLIGPTKLAARLAGQKVNRILITSFAVSLALPLFISVFRPIYYPGRYTIIALPALVLVLGSALARFAARPWVAALCLVMLLAAAVTRIQSRNLNLAGDPDEASEKATAEFILQAGKSGDAVVFTGLSRPAMDYYFARASAQSRFLEIDFPYEPAYPPLPNMQKTHQAKELQADATRVAARLLNIPEDGTGRVWLVYGYDRGIASPILKAELDRHLIYRTRMNGAGPAYTSILRYDVGESAGGRNEKLLARLGF